MEPTVNRWMICGFTAISAVFESYRVDYMVLMKGLHAIEPQSRLKGSASSECELRTHTAGLAGQHLPKLA